MTARERRLNRERRKRKQAKIEKVQTAVKNVLVVIGIIALIMAFDVVMTMFLFENPFRSLEIITVVSSVFFGAWLFLKAFPGR